MRKEFYYIMDYAGRFLSKGEKYDVRVTSTYLHNDAIKFSSLEEAKKHTSGQFQKIRKI